MLFPGIKKVRDKFNLSDDGTFVTGVVKNSRIRLCDGHNCKILYMQAPAEITDQTREALKKFSQKPYKAKVQVDTQSVTYTFTEILWPYSWEKICEVLEETAKIFFNANPDLDPAEKEGGEQDASLNSKSLSMENLFKRFGVLIIAFLAPFIFNEWKSISAATNYSKAVSEQCPLQVDEYTRLESSKSSWHKVYLNYTIIGHEDLMDEAPQIIKENFVNALKADGSAEYYYGKKVWFILNYDDPDGNQIFQVKIVPIDYKP